MVFKHQAIIYNVVINLKILKPGVLIFPNHSKQIKHPKPHFYHENNRLSSTCKILF